MRLPDIVAAKLMGQVGQEPSWITLCLGETVSSQLHAAAGGSRATTYTLH